MFHSDGVRKVPLNEQFFTGYRKTILKPTEILLNVELPYSSKVIIKKNYQTLFYILRIINNDSDDMFHLALSLNQ